MSKNWATEPREGQRWTGNVVPDPYRVRVIRGRTVTTIELSGDLDLGAQETIERALRDALAEPAALRLLVDARDVTYVDTIATHASFVKAREAAHAAGMSFHVLPSATVRRALEVTGLEDVLQEP